MSFAILLKLVVLAALSYLPPLLVPIIGLRFLRHLRPDPLYRTAACGLWIVLAAFLLDLVFNGLLWLFADNISHEYYDALFTLMRTVNFGLMLLKTTGYGFVVRAVVLAIRTLPESEVSGD